MPIGLEDILVNNAAGFTIASARDNNVRGIYWVATTGDRDLIGDASLSTSDLRSQYTICIVGGDIYIYTNSSIADLDWTNAANWTQLATGDLAALSASLTAEIAARIAGDSAINTTVSNLTTTVNGNTSSISTNASDISSNTTSISNNVSSISTNASAISQNATDLSSEIATTNSEITSIQSTVSSNSSSIGTNSTDIATNTSAIATNVNNITSNTTAATGPVTVHNDVSNAGSGAIITSAERTLLNSVENSADVTDATNVEAAGALMDGDFTANGIMKRTGAGTYAAAVADTDYQDVLAEGAFADGDKTKLNGIATGATANQTDAHLLARANHTGTQLAATISDFDTEVTNNSSVAANTAKVGITAQQASDISTNNSKISYTDASAVAANTAKVGITPQQASDITANNAKISYTDASAVAANTAKVTFPGFGTVGGTALEGDTTLLQLGTTNSTALAGDTTTITSGQASAITANTAKTGITSGQASEITANTAKTGITSGQASAITANTAKVTFPGFGTSAGTALEGDTSLFDGAYTSLTSVPGTFAPSAHNHSISEVTSLQSTLDGLIPYTGASSNVNLNSKTLTGVSSITSSAALFGTSPANLRSFNIKGTGLNGRLSLQGGSGDSPGLEMTTDGNTSRVLLRLMEVGTDGTALQIFTEPEGGGIGKHLEIDDDGTLYVFPSGTSAATAGDAGFKNNSGTMQFKNSSGSWTNIPSSGGGSTNELDGQILEYKTRTAAFSNGAHEGEILKINSDTLVYGKVYQLLGSGWATTLASSAARSVGLLGWALGTSSATNGLFHKGILESSLFSFTAGDTLYLDPSNDGLLTATAPSTSTHVVRVMGYAITSTRIYFNPSPTYIQID